MKYCPKCSAVLGDSDQFCSRCGAAYDLGGAQPGADASGGNGAEAGSTPKSTWSPTGGAQVYGDPPPQYLVLCILALIFCCTPFGIVSLVYNSKIDGLMAQGRVDEAWNASKTTKNWLIASFVTGLVVGLLYFILVVVSVVVGAGSGY